VFGEEQGDAVGSAGEAREPAGGFGRGARRGVGHVRPQPVDARAALPDAYIGHSYIACN
jgi:hypothetical protein